MHRGPNDRKNPSIKPRTHSYHQSNHHKSIRVGGQYYQAQIPPEATLDKQSLRNSLLERLVYQHDRLPRKAVSEYLQFVDQLMAQGQNDGLMLGSTGREKHQEKALDFLAKMSYSIVRAKFYILFPCLQYACRFNGESLDLTEPQMMLQIENHMDSLRNNRTKAGQKWRAGLQILLRQKASLQRVNNHIEQAKQLKLEVPEHIKEEIDAVNKASRDIKRMLNGCRQTYEDLLAKKEQVEAFRIHTNEFIQLKNLFERVVAWRNRCQQFERQADVRKVNIKAVSELVVEYESLPLAHVSEKTMKFIKEIKMIMLELRSIKIDEFASERDKPSAKEAVRILQLLESAPVEGEQLDRVKVLLRNCLQVREQVLMELQDSKSSHPYQEHIQRLQRQPIQYQLIHEMKERMDYEKKIKHARTLLKSGGVKVKELENFLLDMQDRFDSPELRELVNEVQKIRTLHDRILSILENEFPQTLADLLNFYTCQSKMISQSQLEMNLRECPQHYALNKELMSRITMLLQQFKEHKAPRQHAFTTLHEMIQHAKRLARFNIESQQTKLALYLCYHQLTSMGILLFFLKKFNRPYQPSFPQEEEAVLVQFCSRADPTVELLDGTINNCAGKPLVTRTGEFKACELLGRRMVAWHQQANSFLNSPLSERSDRELSELLEQELPKNETLAKDLMKSRRVQTWDRQIKAKFQFKMELSVEDQAFLAKCGNEVTTIKQITDNEQIKFKSLTFMMENRVAIEKLLQFWVSQPYPEKVIRKQELNRQLKELGQAEECAEIDALKEYLDRQIKRYSDWKQANQQSKQFHIKYYCKLPLMMISYEKGAEISPVLEDVVRMRNHFKEVLQLIDQATPIPHDFEILARLYTRTKQKKVFYPVLFEAKRLYRYLKHWQSMADKIIMHMPVIRCEERLATDALKPEHAFEERERRKIKPPKVFLGDSMITETYLSKKKKGKSEPLVWSPSEAVEHTEASPPYCICLRGELNADIQWIECDRCKRWFHSECIFLKLNNSKTNLNYICEVCCIRHNEALDEFGNSPWTKYERISLEIWLEIYEESLHLPVFMKQAEIIQSIEKERVELLVSGERLLKQGIANRNKGELEHLQKEVALLINKCLWMPIRLEIIDRLIIFLKNMDFGRELNRAISLRNKKQIRKMIEQGCDGITPENQEIVAKARKRIEELEECKEVLKDGYQKAEIKGQVFQGYWKDGMLERGKVLKDGVLIYDGELKDLKFHGRGIHHNHNRALLPENFSFSNLDFSELKNSWARYEGQFEKNKRHGWGCLFLDEDLMFRGEFRNGEAHGEGSFQRRGVQILKGKWKKNRCLTGI